MFRMVVCVVLLGCADAGPPPVAGGAADVATWSRHQRPHVWERAEDASGDVSPAPDVPREPDVPPPPSPVFPDGAPCEVSLDAPPMPVATQVVALGSLVNASALTLLPTEPGRVVTADDGGDAHALTVSLLADGAFERRLAHVIDGEVEGLATRDGHPAVLAMTGQGPVVIHRGQTIRLGLSLGPDWVGEIPPPRQMVSEALAVTEHGWEVLVTVTRPGEEEVLEAPRRVMRVRFNHGGALMGVIPLVEDGAPYDDFGASLDSLADGAAVVGGFLRPRAVLVGADGQVRPWVDLPFARVEGVAFDADSCRLYVVRECLGDGWGCRPDHAPGPPLAVIQLR